MKSAKENLEIVLEQIKRDKSHGKHITKVKVYQYEIKDEKPCNMFVMLGMREDGSGTKQLIDMGYNINFVKTDKQYNENTMKVKQLHTTCLEIRW